MNRNGGILSILEIVLIKIKKSKTKYHNNKDLTGILNILIVTLHRLKEESYMTFPNKQQQKSIMLCLLN